MASSIKIAKISSSPNNPIHNLPDTLLISKVIRNLSNYYDLLSLKLTDKYLKSVISSNSTSFKKIAEIITKNNKKISLITMNVMNLEYRSESQPLYGREIPKTTSTYAPPQLLSITTLNYSMFRFCSPLLDYPNTIISISVKLCFINSNITIEINNCTEKIKKQICLKIIKNVNETELLHYINKLLTLYHKAKIPDNYTFIVFNYDDYKDDISLDVIVTKKNLQHPSIVHIE